MLPSANESERHYMAYITSGKVSDLGHCRQPLMAVDFE